jgi:hypothetical protein
MITFLTAEALPAIQLKAAGSITSAFRREGSFREPRVSLQLFRMEKLSSLGPSSRAPRKQRDLQHKTQHARVSCSRTKAGDRFCIGIYETDGLNTPGVGTVPDAHCLASIPEAHCYLKRGSQRIDVTSARAERTGRPLERFLVELDVAPEQAGNYKSQFHQEFLRGWLKSASRSRAFSFDNLWAVREARIRALEIHS